MPSPQEGIQGVDMRATSRHLRVVLVGLLVALVFARQAAAQAKITGTVVDDAGKPIKAATVTAESGNMGQSFTATTDDKGKFTMIGLRPGAWHVTASAPGYLPEAGDVQLRSGNNANPPMTIAVRRSGAMMGALGNISAKDLQADLAAADALFSQQKWDESIAAYRAILAKAPSLSAINLQIASAYRAKKDFTSAIAVYTDLLGVEPDNQKAIIGLSEANAAKGDSAAAESVLLKAAQNPEVGSEVFFELGELSQAKGDVAASVSWYQKASAADPSWGKPLYRLGENAIKQGNKTAAADYMTRAITVDPSSSEAALAKAAIDQLNK
ncbi:MAG TPA: carboxypeptidase regulatory-like domain-containing protein [Vicinamibacterales bacterium]|nr:carboxypeptidase regulatory-like domain-containing protein [Vicinamibacterales bacterium]